MDFPDLHSLRGTVWKIHLLFQIVSRIVHQSSLSLLRTIFLCSNPVLNR